MSPFLEPGDAVAVEWNAGTADAGELVVARAGDGAWVVHRVLEPSRPLLKGDRALATDPPAEIWGRVVAVRRGDGIAPFSPNALDRLIARMSLGTIAAEGLLPRARAALLRRALRLLAAARRRQTR
jgi:hypothetical protein